MAESDNGGMSVREAGRKGGKTTRQRYGPEFYQEIGQKGGKTVSERYSHEHFQNIGRKGGRKVAELIDRAKRMDQTDATANRNGGSGNGGANGKG
jgi:general stress protein YciG